MVEPTANHAPSYTVRSRGRRFARMQFQGLLDRLDELERRIVMLEAEKAKTDSPKRRGRPPKTKPAEAEETHAEIQ